MHLFLSDSYLFYSIHTRNEVGWGFCMIDGYLILVHTSSVDLSASRCKQTIPIHDIAESNGVLCPLQGFRRAAP